MQIQYNADDGLAASGHRVASNRWRWPGLLCVLLAFLPAASASAHESPNENPGPEVVPSWVFPLDSTPPSRSAPFNSLLPLHIPGSRRSFTHTEVNDPFYAPDWHPASHSVMPGIVASGRPPEVFACGYCHLPGGQGRPENASLAGLPAAYILSQLADYRSGARSSAANGPYAPADFMIHTVRNATVEELSTAAAYFSAQSLRPRTVIVETERVPRSHVVGLVYTAVRGGGSEPLGQRLLEFAPDADRHENRDDGMRYVSYVPRGSVGRGRHLAKAGLDSPANACVSCHGPQLRGVGLIPPIAGRSPTYILRQLIAFKTGARSGATGEPMRNVARNLNLSDMIDAAAYAASLPP